MDYIVLIFMHNCLQAEYKGFVAELSIDKHVDNLQVVYFSVV